MHACMHRNWNWMEGTNAYAIGILDWKMEGIHRSGEQKEERGMSITVLSYPSIPSCSSVMGSILSGGGGGDDSSSTVIVLFVFNSFDQVCMELCLLQSNRIDGRMVLGRDLYCVVVYLLYGVGLRVPSTIVQFSSTVVFV